MLRLFLNIFSIEVLCDLKRLMFTDLIFIIEYFINVPMFKMLFFVRINKKTTVM